MPVANLSVWQTLDVLFLFKLVGVSGKHLHFGRDSDLGSGCACVRLCLRADSFMYAV